MKTLKYVADLVGAAFTLSVVILVGLVLQLPLPLFVVLSIFVMIIVTMCVMITQAMDRRIMQRKSRDNGVSTNEHVG